MNGVCLQFYKKLSNSLENVVWTNNEVKKAEKWSMNVWSSGTSLLSLLMSFFADPATFVRMIEWCWFV